MRFEERKGLQNHPMATKGLLRAFVNSVYSVQEIDALNGMVVLMIKRHDNKPIREWSSMQAIKNAIVGPEREAVEIYPPDSELVDVANMYHLWVLPEGQRLGFGFAQLDRER